MTKKTIRAGTTDGTGKTTVQYTNGTMDQYQEFIHKSRYARWLPEEGRRESWPETVNRYVSFWRDRGQISEEEKVVLFDAIHQLEVMPSMRCLMTAGPALERDNVAGFNCSYLPVDSVRAFDELMYILLCGTGVGFSVESQYVEQLPTIAESFHDTDTTIVVADSKIGWAKAFKQLVSMLYVGEIPSWDVSRIRPAGAPLKTFGGRASGPDPLVELFVFTTEVFQAAKGRRLSQLECHDICCKIAEVVVVGGVRRSALISLSDARSHSMSRAKAGQWWVDNSQRALANNSAVYTKKPDFDFFLDEMRALYESKSGERGVFSRAACQHIAARNGRRESDREFGTNPCSEIILRPNQFCNLSEVVVRPEDTLATLKDKVRKAAILGTLQATLTDFRYLRKIWKTNTEEEALLGVSLTGIMDHPVLSGRDLHGGQFAPKKFRDPITGEVCLAEVLAVLRKVAVDTNKEWADRLGIAPSAAITCVKPSGTVSQLVNSASGIHPRFSPFYVRTVRADSKDPLARLMVDQGFPMELDVTNSNNLVFSFPVSGPVDSKCADEVGALEQLRLWLIYQAHWCEHKPSITVYYRDDEFLEVAQWMWKNFDVLSGIALLPYSEHTYQQAPYQEISRSEYEDRKKALPEFDWALLEEYEREDQTTGSQELACVGNVCEMPDLT